MLSTLCNAVQKQVASQLARQWKLEIAATVAGGEEEPLRAGRGRRIILTLHADGQVATVVIHVADKVWQWMVRQATGQDAIDATEDRIAQALLEFAEDVVRGACDTVRSRCGDVAAAAPLTVRANTPIASLSEAGFGPIVLTTSEGTVSIVGLSAGSQAQDEGDGGSYTGQGRQPRVLVVDDDADSCRLLVNILSRMGVATNVAHRGESALRTIARSAHDLVLLDYEMPEMDGLTCLRQIRERYGGLPVIMVTAHKKAELIRRASTLGVAGYIIKPYRMADVQDRVARVLGFVTDGADSA